MKDDENNLTKLSPRQFSLFKNYTGKKIFVEDYPVFLIIEPTNNCNFQCRMCPRQHMTRPVGNMNFDLFKKIIDEIHGNVEFIWLHFFGEPLMNTRILDFIEYAGGKGITLGMSTNSSLLKGNTAKAILDSKLDLLLISIDSLSDKKFKKIRPGGSLSAILENVDTFLKYHKEKKSILNVVLSMINLPENKDEIGQFEKRWELSEAINIKVKSFDNFANQETGIHQLPSSPTEANPSCVCSEPWRGLVVGWDGQVVPCCYDFNYKNVLGNVNDFSVSEVWNSKKMLFFRSLHTKGLRKEILLCKSCDSHHENYYHGISLSSCFNPSAQETLTYFNKGLYSPEITADYQIVWTKKEFVLLIQDRFQDARIIFRNENPYEKTVTMRVTLLDEKIGEFEIQKITEVYLRTPDSLKGRLLRYVFSLNHDWIPKEYGINNDTRRLGVIVERIIN
jgi:radical SAM protein with 4Fe4S-binding SPASM domain